MNDYIFKKYPKTPRFESGVTYYTEKIDGTNARVIILESGEVLAASKNRLITPDDDNYGFAKWVEEHAHILRQDVRDGGLGLGEHCGEWWGKGIGRGYGLEERRFSLFNSGRWEDNRPKCCHVVPFIGMADGFSTETLNMWAGWLKRHGSFVTPRSLGRPTYDNPEGVVAYHSGSGTTWKATIDKHKDGRK